MSRKTRPIRQNGPRYSREVSLMLTTQRLRWLSTLLLAAAWACGAAPLDDGPYLIAQPDGSWLARTVRGDAAAPEVIDRKVNSGDAFTVGAAGSVPAFQVRVRGPEKVAPDTVKPGRKAPMFVVADTHGEYQILAELLQKQRIVDAAMRWAFGKGHVVVLGDVFDRGPNQIEILWLFYELQAQAAKAGGGLHLIIGNHEAMVMGGDLRYLNAKYQRVADALGARSYAQLVGPNTLLGQWLRTRPAVLKIGNVLCLHGGVSPGLVERNLGLSQVNSLVRDVLNGVALDGERQSQASFVMGRSGPLWYRGYFADAAEQVATSEEVDRMLAAFGVTSILVGHTRVETVTALYGRRVVAVQVYPHRDESSGAAVMQALRIEGQRFLRADISGKSEPL